LAKATQAQAYVETMRVNTMRAKRRRASQGHKMPTGGRKWAFEYDPATGQYRKNEARAAWIARCYQWVLEEGLSLYACCRRLEAEGVPPPGYELWARSVEKGRAWNRRRPPSPETWFPGTLRGLLLDEGNVGRFYAYKHETARGKDGKKRQVTADPSKWVLVYEDSSQAIVTQEQHEAFKAKMRRNQENSPRHAKHPYPPLRGLVFCPLCGRRMAGWRCSHTGVTYYKCEVCRNLVNAFKLWDELREEIKTRLLEPERLLPAVRAQLESGRTLEGLEAEQARLSRELENWKQVRDKARRFYFLKQSYTEEQYLADDKEMERRQESVARDLEDVRSQISRLKFAALEEDGIRRFCKLAAQNLDSLDDDQWRVLLERMRVRVVVPPGEPVIVQVALPVAEPQSGAIAYQSSP
ncbi:MAG: recombinase family protein, partial [Chloroflexota bacterium]|nr:recombinase family protein [Chloroflexota bacterium]